MIDPNDNLMNELREIRNSISTLDSKIGDVKLSLQNEIHNIRSEILQFQLKTRQLDDLTEWSTRFREKVTLADLERMRDELTTLKEFKVKATVSFAMVQFVVAGLIAWFTKG